MFGGGASTDSAIDLSARPTAWSPLRIGAGGFIRDIDVAADGTMVCRTDTYGGYVWNPTLQQPGPGVGIGMWQQLITPSSMPPGDTTSTLAQIQQFPANQGIYDIRIAPTNTSIFYMLYLGYFFKSANKGTTWQACPSFSPLSLKSMGANDDLSQNGYKMAVDPINANRVFFGVGGKGQGQNVQNNSFWKTLDGGSTFTQITQIAASSSTVGSYAVAFDNRVSTQSGGNSQTIFAGSYGTGIYKSTDSGANWTLLNSTGMPVTFRRMVVDVNGVLWLTDNTGSATNLWKYSSSTWTNITSTMNNGSTYHAIAIDPTVANAQRIILTDGGGALTQSINGGTSWTGSFSGGTPNGGNPSGLIATDIPYLASEAFFDIGNSVFDANGILREAEGVGVWYSTPPTIFGSAWFRNSQSAGIEQLVSNMAASPPNGYLICASWDRATIAIIDPLVYRTTYQPASFTAAPGASSCDWASATPSFIVSARAGGVLDYSSDKGITWNTKSMPSSGGGGGCIAASTITNFVFFEASDGVPFYTTDGGTNWNSLASYFNTTYGVPLAGGGTQWGDSFLQNAQIVCADRVTPNVFYTFNKGAAGSGGGVYKSSDSGATWPQRTIAPFPVEGGNPMLRSVPGKAGHLFYTGGQGFNPSHPQAFKLWRSTDGAQTWTDANSLLREVWCVGFGATFPGASYPTVFAYGWYNGVSGIWRSIDNCVSFQKIGEITMYGTFDIPKWIEGDANIPGACYVGLVGSGFARGALA